MRGIVDNFGGFEQEMVRGHPEVEMGMCLRLMIAMRGSDGERGCGLVGCMRLSGKVRHFRSNPKFGLQGGVRKVI